MKEQILTLFKAVVAPEYATMTDEQLSPFYDEAIIEIPTLVDNKLYPRMVSLLMAHMISIGKRAIAIGGAGQTGQIKKTKVGDLEREYAIADQSNFGDGTLASTLYGAEFLRLRKKILFTPRYIC